jgi:predicted RND superfamily exporter protein
MIQPIGLTVTGGLVSSTFITLFFIPVMYSLLNDRKHTIVIHKAKHEISHSPQIPGYLENSHLHKGNGY